MQTEIFTTEVLRDECLNLAWGEILKTLKNSTIKEEKRFAICMKLAMKDAGRTIVPNQNPLEQIGKLFSQLDAEGLRTLVLIGRSRAFQSLSAGANSFGETNNPHEIGGVETINPEPSAESPLGESAEVPR